MRRIRQILQLHFGAQASSRVIARELGVGRSTVQGYLAWRRMPGATAVRGMARSRTTCPAPIVDTPNGAPSGSNARRAPSGRTPRR